MLVRGSANRPRSIEDLLGATLMARLDRLDLLSRKVFAGKLPGERRSKRRGQSVEFDDYRPYIAGDDLRRLDWKIYARLDRLFLKLFLEEQDMALQIVIDASASMDAGPPGATKLLMCQRLAMALGYIGLVNHDRLSVTVFGGPRLERLPEVRGRRSVQRLGQFLLEAARPSSGLAGPGADFNSALRAVGMTRRGRGVLVLLSDFLVREGYEDGLRHLAGGGFDTYCVQVLSPGEIEPETESDEGFAPPAAGRRERAGGGVAGDLRLTDVETGDAAEVTVTAELVRRYKANLERHCSGLSSYCAAREMTHLLVRSDTDVESLVFEVLRKRGLLK